MYDGVINKILQYDSIIDFSTFPYLNNTYFDFPSREDIFRWLMVELITEFNEPSMITEDGSFFEEEINWEDNIDQDDIDAFFEVFASKNNFTLIDLNYSVFNLSDSITEEYKLLLNRIRHNYLKEKLKETRQPPQYFNLHIPLHLMTPKQRWDFYSVWLHQLLEYLQNEREYLRTEYARHYRLLLDKNNGKMLLL
ncbi:hypothetical protein NQ317_014852 [Molorchus minor]|uniref:Uncharacterized protein n=1 Tax=Molorchus minor TaxID=1323400 RepID=A0ABQ9JT66_9CUCU|nr:hypothetical protein NQ317_014852 [Molorchus minor]